MATVGSRLLVRGPGTLLGVAVGWRVEMDTVTVGVREVMGVAKDVVVGVVSVVDAEVVGKVEVKVVEMSWEMEVVTGGLVVTGGAEDVAVMDGVAEGPGDESPPYVHVPSVPRGILGP